LGLFFSSKAFVDLEADGQAPKDGKYCLDQLMMKLQKR
jgi:hypothetical protein